MTRVGSGSFSFKDSEEDSSMRNSGMTARDLLKKIDETGKHRVKTVSVSCNGRVDEHFMNGRSVGFSFHYPDGRHEYREVKTSV